MFVADHTGITDGFQANGQCDACKQHTINSGGGTAFIHESYYSQVFQDPVEARRRARIASRRAWQTPPLGAS